MFLAQRLTSLGERLRITVFPSTSSDELSVVHGQTESGLKKKI